jgi:hypothetical protein
MVSGGTTDEYRSENRAGISDGFRAILAFIHAVVGGSGRSGCDRAWDSRLWNCSIA